MGANVTFKVKVLRLVEDWIEVYAVTTADAVHLAGQCEGVARVLGAWHALEDFEANPPRPDGG